MASKLAYVSRAGKSRINNSQVSHQRAISASRAVGSA